MLFFNNMSVEFKARIGGLKDNVSRIQHCSETHEHNYISDTRFADLLDMDDLMRDFLLETQDCQREEIPPAHTKLIVKERKYIINSKLSIPITRAEFTLPLQQESISLQSVTKSSMALIFSFVLTISTSKSKSSRQT
ncbi:uncharacterized protein EV154DRAFT_557245 [Mucor mucedo]|uniref:uncharacterized protein n=1 Tax=Mucor mucedo TaxID=29922 RepID=UPI0022203349|nr:uncharacterized protein EV154DRAFT_557245 [Mucor mucedo]KAI7865308.1 hypothetical protein EV154DRAFT_557245 [Mucor mucedo]